MRVIVLVLVLAAAGPSWAQVRPAVIYPIDGEGVTAQESADLESTLQSALLRTMRSGPFGPASPPVLPTASCGVARSAAPACLARSAGSGVVLVGVARRAGPMLALSLTAVDGRGVVSGPVSLKIDPQFDNPSSFTLPLERLSIGAQRPVAARPPAPLPPPDSQGAAAAPPDRPSAPPAAVAAEPPSRWSWEAKAALGAAGGTVAAFGGGVALGVLAKRQSENLTARFNDHSLTAADASAYSAVDRKTTLANLLFVTGSVLAVTALVFWALVPDEPGSGRTF